MFRNTHSIFADIIQAEIFEPNLSNLIPNSLHNFARFRALPAIPTFLEPSVHVLCTILRPCLQLLRSITLTLIVSNCLSFPCCIMIRHSLPCSFHLFLPSIVFILHVSLTCFIKYLSSLCHVCFCILNIKLELDSYFVLFYSTLLIK